MNITLSHASELERIMRAALDAHPDFEGYCESLLSRVDVTNASQEALAALWYTAIREIPETIPLDRKIASYASHDALEVELQRIMRRMKRDGSLPEACGVA